jgi:mRNA interferase YafQ
MLLIKRTSKFKSDYKRANKQNCDVSKLKKIIVLLSNKVTLDKKYKDHSLSGKLHKYRDCHIEPDWILIYEITDNELNLLRLGSHAELFK